MRCAQRFLSETKKRGKMFTHDLFADRRSLLALAAPLLVLVACSGGNGFTAAAPFDASAADASDTTDANDDVDASTGNIVLNPNDNGSVDASVDSGSNGDDGTANPPPVEAGITDASPGDEISNVLTCSASELQCDGGCTAADTNNCGACGVKCSAPASGTATCALSGGHYACGIACNVNYSHCGNSCVDLRNDANNCGRCGHSCLGAACQASSCQSWVVANEPIQNTLLLGQRGGFYAHTELVTDGKNVVWIDSQAGILETSATGGPSSPIINIAPMSATNTLDFGNLAIANGTAVWTMWDSNNGVSVWKATATGKSTDAGTGVMVASLGAMTAGDVPSGMALDATAANAYFIDSITVNGSPPLNPGLFTCVLANKSCTRLEATIAPTGVAFSNDVAAAGGRIFFSDSARTSVDQYLGTYEMTGGPVIRLAVDSTYVYWLDFYLANPDAGISATSFDVYRVQMSSLSVAPPAQVLHAQTGILYGMATDGTNLYFSNTGNLQYVPATGSATTQVLKSGQQAYAIATGGGAIYWLNGDNTIDGIAAP
jgi:hypothetical protein